MTALSTPTVMFALDLAMAAAAIPALLASLYLVTLSVLSLLSRLSRNETAIGEATASRWAIVVPAHNEESGIAQTVRSLREIDYPVADVLLLVVADNCTDDTAVRAREAGAMVLERQDAMRRGKGYALQAGFSWLEAQNAESWSRVLVVDADSDVTPNVLRTADRALDGGAVAAQLLYLPRVSDGSARAAVQAIALTAFHAIRSEARALTGMSAGLRGNGMAFSRHLLRDLPYHAVSLAEDVEYGLMLAERGHPVAYVGDAVVRGDMPVSDAANATQGTRWVGGRRLLLAAWSRRLLAVVGGAPSLRTRFLALELLIDLAVPPLSALLVLVFAGSAVGTVIALLTGQIGLALSLWGAALVGVLLHAAHAALRTRLEVSLVELVPMVARYATNRLRHTVAARHAAQVAWTRTPRS